MGTEKKWGEYNESALWDKVTHSVQLSPRHRPIMTFHQFSQCMGTYDVFSSQPPKVSCIRDEIQLLTIRCSSGTDHGIASFGLV